MPEVPTPWSKVSHMYSSWGPPPQILILGLRAGDLVTRVQKAWGHSSPTHWVPGLSLSKATQD